MTEGAWSAPRSVRRASREDVPSSTLGGRREVLTRLSCLPRGITGGYRDHSFTSRFYGDTASAASAVHFGIAVLGLNYGFGGQMKVEEITGGAPYGATTITRPDAQRQPSENELAGARYQGRAVAETAAKFHG